LYPETQRQKKESSSNNSKEDEKGSNESDYDEEVDRLEQKQEGENWRITSATTNKVF
jgi:hypothetical protein